MRDVWIRGAAMTRFGKHVDRTARDLVEEAVTGALSDAELEVGDVQFVFVGNALAGAIGGQECMRAQTVLRRTGLMGVPMTAVENADCSGSTALHLAWQAVAHGAHDCVLVVGYEKFDHNDRARSYRALNSAMDLSELAERFGAESGRGDRNLPMQMHGGHSSGGGTDIFGPVPLAQVSVKNHYHASLNPCAHYREPVTVEQVLASPRIAGPLTRLMFAPLSDGAACLVVCAADFAAGRRGGAPLRPRRQPGGGLVARAFPRPCLRGRRAGARGPGRGRGPRYDADLGALRVRHARLLPPRRGGPPDGGEDDLAGRAPAGEPQRRPDRTRAPARRDGHRAGRRADLAARGPVRGASGRIRADGAGPQHRGLDRHGHRRGRDPHPRPMRRLDRGSHPNYSGVTWTGRE